MKSIPGWAAGLAVVASASLVAPLAAQGEDSAQTVDPSLREERRQQRLERIQAMRERNPEPGPGAAEPLGLQALLSPTVGGRPSPQVVGMATDVSLDIDGDFDLGGFLFKDGVPFLHNDGGGVYGNTALGLDALTNATLIPNYPYFTKGAYNTAFGYNALQETTDGAVNTAVGWSAMRANTIGFSNTAVGAGTLSGYGAFYNSGNHNTVVGHFAMVFNEEGNYNTALGAFALQQPGATDSYNTAIGGFALFSTNGDNNVGVGYGAAVSGSNGVAVGFDASAGPASVTVGARAGRSGSGTNNTAVGFHALDSIDGHFNTAVGFYAGSNWTTGYDNIALGSAAYGVAGEEETIRIGGAGFQSRTFIAGIRGATSGHVSGFDQEVCVDPNGQLGPCTVSTARLKEAVETMSDVSAKFGALRPVSFRYRSEGPTSDQPLQYGLIAEEVAEVFPTLVSRDDDGRPYTVRYELLTPILLKELQDEKQRREGEVEDLRRQVAELRKLVADLKRRDEIQRE